ncbi:MAG: cation diffusion facilitator family transporter [Caldimonas sp.]
MAESRIAVYGAIAANVTIACLKFTAAAFTGSSAMLSEGIHSTVDTGNGLLLLVGLRLAEKPPDERHPFGHGQELYFWSLIVAVLIFGVGGGVSVYEGILRLLSPEPLGEPTWSYAVLAAAFVFEGASLFVAVRQFRRSSEGQPFWAALKKSKDPALYTVIAEDSAALAGLAAAALGIVGSQVLGMPSLDAIASIVIGGLLCAVSSLLVFQARTLLVGQAVDAPTAAEIRRIAAAESGVRRSAWPLTMYFGPNEVLLALDIEFEPGVLAADATSAVARIEAAVRQRFPEISRIYIESHRLSAAESQPMPPAPA